MKNSVIVSRRSARTSTATAKTGTQRSEQGTSRAHLVHIGMAIFNMRSSECTLTQFVDTIRFTETLQVIIAHDPILVPEWSTHGPLYNILGQFFTAELCTLKSSVFSKEEGSFFTFTYRYTYIQVGFTVGIEIVSKYSKSQVETSGDTINSISAASALFKYLQEQKMNFYEKSIKMSFMLSQGTCKIDYDTVHNLELVCSLGANGKNSLLKTIDFTLTQMGSRLLRTSIVQPLTCVEKIVERQKGTECLLADERKLQGILRALRGFPDLDSIIGCIVRVPDVFSQKAIELYLGHLLSIREFLNAIPSLRAALDDLDISDSSILESARKALGDSGFDKISNVLDETLDAQDAGSAKKTRFNRLFAVKSQGDDLLSVARQTYNEVTTDIQDLIASYTQKYDIRIRSTYDSKMHCYILSANTDEVSEDLVPLEFINRKRKKKTVTFSSIELLKLNERLQESASEIILLSENVCVEALNAVRKMISSFYKCSESIGILDLLCSFARYAKAIVKSCVPEFTDTLAFRKGRHPIKDRLLGSSFVPNDTFVYAGCNFQSGKSTYLRQIALLCIMAQIGCHIPAEYISVKIMEKIFSRIGDEDSPCVDVSAFTLEMKQLSHIFNSSNESSLIIIDELGRGTSLHDAMGITAAICEDLIKRKAFTFFVTHFIELATYLDRYPNVVNLHLEIEFNQNLKYLYKIEPGVTNDENYGIRLAKMIGYPNSITDIAQELSQKYLNKVKQSKTIDPREEEYRNQKQLYEKLIQIANAGCMEGKELIQLLKNIREEYIETSSD